MWTWDVTPKRYVWYFSTVEYPSFTWRSISRSLLPYSSYFRSLLLFEDFIERQIFEDLASSRLFPDSSISRCFLNVPEFLVHFTLMTIRFATRSLHGGYINVLERTCLSFAHSDSAGYSVGSLGISLPHFCKTNRLILAGCLCIRSRHK